MATKTDRSSEKQSKRFSKGKRIHTRRLKQEARKTGGISHT